MIKEIFFSGFISLILFFTADARKIIDVHHADRFGGIGISVDIDSVSQLPYIVEVLSGKPGAVAGLRSGDCIIKINHWSTFKKSRVDVASKLRGRVGTIVRLYVKRFENNRTSELFFEIRRARIIIMPQPANLCEALDSLLKSAADTFSRIKGKMISEPVIANHIPNYEWESELIFPKFGRASVLKKFDTDTYFQGVCFEGKDSIQAMHRYDILLSDIRNCMPYTCTMSFQETNSAQMTSFYTCFYISQVKKNVPISIEGSVITVKYEHLYQQLPRVLLIYTINKNGALQLNR